MSDPANTVLEMMQRLAPITPPDASDALWLTDFRYKTALLQAFSGRLEPLHDISHVILGGVPVRLYRPGPGLLPVLFHVHGGGAIAGSLDVHDAPLRQLAKATGWLVAAPNYHLAPEHRFPAQIEDCYAALASLSADPSIIGDRIVVSGDSIGGTIATALAVMARDRDGPSLVGQILLYPNTDLRPDASYPSRRSEDGKIISASDLERQITLYTGTSDERASSLASPILTADLSNLPLAYVALAEHDPLHDEGAVYSNRLQAAGVRVNQKLYTGAIHAFLQMGRHLNQTTELLGDLNNWLSTLRPS